MTVWRHNHASVLYSLALSQYQALIFDVEVWDLFSGMFRNVQETRAVDNDIRNSLWKEIVEI